MVIELGCSGLHFETQTDTQVSETYNYWVELAPLYIELKKSKKKHTLLLNQCVLTFHLTFVPCLLLCHSDFFLDESDSFLW